MISPYHRIYYIDEGYGELSRPGQVLSLEPGYLYLIPSFTLCNLVCYDYLSQYFVQFFEEPADSDSILGGGRALHKAEASKTDAANFQRLVSINPGRGINRSDNPQVYEKDMYYKEYQSLNENQNVQAFLETQGLLLQLAARVARPPAVTNSQAGYMPAKMVDAIQYVLANLHLPLSVASIAARANLHPDYFSRRFELHTGKRPAAYIMEKRIERAKNMLITSGLSHTEIANLSGFSYLSQFSRVFRKETGYTPGQYKQMARLV